MQEARLAELRSCLILASSDLTEKQQQQWSRSQIGIKIDKVGKDYLDCLVQSSSHHHHAH